MTKRITDLSQAEWLPYPSSFRCMFTTDRWKTTQCFSHSFNSEDEFRLRKLRDMVEMIEEVINRREVVDFISEGRALEDFMYKRKEQKVHYSEQELKDLLGFIYEGEPESEE